MQSFLRTVLFNHTMRTPTIVIRRFISTVRWKDLDTYKQQPLPKQEAIDKVTDFAKVCGADGEGAETVEIAGPWHSGNQAPVGDMFERVTVSVEDANNARMYFYRTTDNTFWDRLHVPRNDQGPHWPLKGIYVKITKAQFDNKKL